MVGSGIVGKRLGGFDGKAVGLEQCLVCDLLEKLFSCVVLILRLLFLGVLLVAAPSDEGAGHYARIGLDNDPVRIALSVVREWLRPLPEFSGLLRRTSIRPVCRRASAG